MVNNTRILNEIDTMAAMLDGMGARLRSLRKEVEKGEKPAEKKRARGLSNAQLNEIRADYWGSITKKK
jgi:hypothetical protein